MVLLMIDVPLSIEAVIPLSHCFFSRPDSYRFIMAAALGGVFGGILRRSLWAFEKDRQAKRSL